MQDRAFDPDRNPVDELADEFAQRLRDGQCPSIATYVEQYPQYAQEIRDVFPPIAMLERISRREQFDCEEAAWCREAGSSVIKQLGDYRIIREIGRGGMGVVYEAVQESLGRTVAVKVLTANAVSLPRQLKRFRREAQAAAKLHHTNIVPIFGVGESNGLNYYVMQYIDGVGLNEAAQVPQGDGKPVSDNPTSRHGGSRTHEIARGCDRRNHAHWKRLAGYGVQVARAVDYAHCRGVLHRDIKPANLLVDCQGTVWITDFGLAKVFGDEELTRSGDFCGTVRYMAPEQFEGRSAPASDIYSIGITLYELATGGPAFGESDPKQLIHRITRHCLPQPRSVNRSLPRELETIILKAAAHDDRHRYATAGELADDLQRFIDGEPIAARRASLAGRLYRWGRRNPALAMLTGLSVSLLLLVAVVASVGYLRVDEARRQALDLAKSEMQSSRELRQASRKANDESERAKREYERAEDNLRLAMQAFEEIMESISSRGLPQLLDVELDEDAPPASPPLITGADAELLQRFLAFYVAFAERNNAGAAVQRETAKAYQRIGDIRQRLGQFEQAVVAYDASLAIYDRIAVQDPADPGLVVAATDVR
ncbi:MAG: hypothetical protein FJ276_30760, partial [Planctomycetes bacterium]|nr:hypothetical protein [Planctomycetota bacterium]